MLRLECLQCGRVVELHEPVADVTRLVCAVCGARGPKVEEKERAAVPFDGKYVPTYMRREK